MSGIWKIWVVSSRLHPSRALGAPKTIENTTLVSAAPQFPNDVRSFIRSIVNRRSAIVKQGKQDNKANKANKRQQETTKQTKQARQLDKQDTTRQLRQQDNKTTRQQDKTRQDKQKICVLHCFVPFLLCYSLVVCLLFSAFLFIYELSQWCFVFIFDFCLVLPCLLKLNCHLI